MAIGIYSLKAVSPVSSRRRQVVELLMIAIGIVQPLATFPLLYELYVTHAQDVSRQSFTTWCLLVVASLLLFIYGLHKRRPAIYAGNVVALAANLLVMNGILLYAR